MDVLSLQIRISVVSIVLKFVVQPDHGAGGQERPAYHLPATLPRLTLQARPTAPIPLAHERNDAVAILQGLTGDQGRVLSLNIWTLAKACSLRKGHTG